jgi:hypothetical protein
MRCAWRGGCPYMAIDGSNFCLGHQPPAGRGFASKKIGGRLSVEENVSVEDKSSNNAERERDRVTEDIKTDGI